MRYAWVRPGGRIVPPAAGDWLSGRAPRSHRGGHWFDPSIAHPGQRPVPITELAVLLSVQQRSTATLGIELAVAVAHTLICIAWAVMTYDSDYAGAGADYYDRRDQRNHEHLLRHHQGN